MPKLRLKYCNRRGCTEHADDKRVIELVDTNRLTYQLEVYLCDTHLKEILPPKFTPIK